MVDVNDGQRTRLLPRYAFVIVGLAFVSLLRPTPTEMDHTITSTDENSTTRVRTRAQHLSPSMRSLPNLFIAGAQKGGTSTIHTRLSSLVCEPIVFPEDKTLLDEGLILRQKEVHFFDDGRRYHSGVDFYRARYANCTKYYAIDSTPDYFVHPGRIREFYNQHGNASELKIILSLREPVAREISMYHNMVRQRLDIPEWAWPVVAENGRVRSFDEYVHDHLLPDRRFLNSYGNYARWIPMWFLHFDRSQILIVAYDELKSNTTAFWSRIESFLGLRIPPLESSTIVNPSRPSEPVPCEVQENLAKIFRASNEELYRILEQNPGPPMEQRPFPRFREVCST